MIDKVVTVAENSADEVKTAFFKISVAMAILILALVTYKDNSCPLAAMTSFVCKLFGRSKSDFSRSVTL